MRPANVYAGGTVDRAADLRRDPERLRAAWEDPTARVVLFHRSRSFVRFEGEAARAVALPVADLAAIDIGGLKGLGGLGGAPLLGRIAGAAYFALDLSTHTEEDVHRHLEGVGELADLRALAPVLGSDDASLLAYARALLHWHSRHGYCGVCGAATESRQGGHVRHCPACGAEHFPRTDPAVIMLVTDGDRCLLGHQNAWPARVYSTLAGFVEPGESLEEAVAREVREEAGIEVEGVEYHSSQPWPFPASIMLGFTARATTTAIHLHDDELADARWFDREELRDPDRRPVQLPSPASIARRLIEDWLA